MRLWHKDLMPVLPRQQLLSQWREVCGIARDINADGTPNHLLVNRVLNYPEYHLRFYMQMVIRQMRDRGYNISQAAYKKCSANLKQARDKGIFPEHQMQNGNFILFDGWHNDIYLRQCLYNLEEKYICGGISNEEWQRICAKFPEYELCS